MEQVASDSTGTGRDQGDDSPAGESMVSSTGHHHLQDCRHFLSAYCEPSNCAKLFISAAISSPWSLWVLLSPPSPPPRSSGMEIKVHNGWISAPVLHSYLECHSLCLPWMVTASLMELVNGRFRNHTRTVRIQSPSSNHLCKHLLQKSICVLRLCESRIDNCW